MRYVQFPQEKNGKGQSVVRCFEENGLRRGVYAFRNFIAHGRGSEKNHERGWVEKMGEKPIRTGTETECEVIQLFIRSLALERGKQGIKS